MDADVQDIRGREWFYPFVLADGSRVSTYSGGKLDAIHQTRLAMLDAVVDETFGSDNRGLRALDLGCHQGFFSQHLARRGFEVTGVDGRAEHVRDAQRMAQATGCARVRFRQQNLECPAQEEPDETFDLVLALGLIYHLENPIALLRHAFARTGRLMVIETQLVPHMSGPVDWGHADFVRPMHGVFGIIDETDETHGPEASLRGICLAPSLEGLIWILGAMGCEGVRRLEVPADGYQQLVTGKRAMVAGFRAQS